MNDSEKNISYRIFKKGKENCSGFDKLLLEANPEINEQVNKLSAVSPGIYQQAVKQSEEKILIKKKAAEKKRHLFRYVSLSAAACFLIFFVFVFRTIFNQPVSLTGAHLYVTPAGKSDTLYFNGNYVAPGEEIHVAFVPGDELEEIRQGVLFSINSDFESTVYYRYSRESGPLSRNKSTKIEQPVRVDEDSEYIYFFIVLSDTPFNEEEQIGRVKRILKKKQLKAEGPLTKEFKDKAASYIYLIRE